VRLPEVWGYAAAKGRRYMYSGWVARLFFAIVAAMAVAGIVGGTACTRWGHPGPTPPTFAPLSTIYVSATTGSDTSGNGSMSSPYKTLTKAVAVLAAAKSLSPSGVTIFMSTGDYDKANGEVFPIVVPTGVTISGSNYGTSPSAGSFVNGVGEDKLFEALVHAPPHTAYTTLEVAPPASVTVTGLYVGASTISLPSSKAFYASLDDLATFGGSNTGLGAGITSRSRNIDGAIVPGGSLSCTSCVIHGNDVGVIAFAVTLPTSGPDTSATASPSASPTTMPVTAGVTLSRSVGDSTIVAKIVDVLTDGNVNVIASDTTFARAAYAYSDAFTPLVPSTIRGAVDFGGGVASSSGGNDLIGARISEMYVTRRFETVSARDDVWNPRQQHANSYGQYPRVIRFGAGATGKNVTIAHLATGSTVTVGPAPVPTPTPSVSPSVSPTTSPT
jgi:hypothetical protein